MEASPLTQQDRPQVFEPKIVQLYRQAFNVENDVALSEGFWRELFLLPADKARLIEILDPLTADDLLHTQGQTRQFFKRSIESTSDPEIALENLTGFVSSVLSKRYTNPSADVIEVFADLDTIDDLMNDLCSRLDVLIRTGPTPIVRSKAIKASLAIVAGGYQTTLASYFTHHDLFPGLMKFADASDDDDFVSLVLLGVLLNLNKFEIQSPYQSRLEDFTLVETMQRLTQVIGRVYATVRDDYLAVHDDAPETWTRSTLHLIGLKNWATPKKQPQPSEDEARELLLLLPSPSAAISLTTYSFVHANKTFASTLVTAPAGSSHETPFASILSATSYLGHNAYRSQRCLQHTVLNLIIIQVLVEDPAAVKQICSADLKLNVRLCRQRLPHLPQFTAARTPVASILDICVDILLHNLRKRLEVSLFSGTIGVMLRIVTYLSSSKTRVSYHWTTAWAALLSVVRFLTQYDADLRHVPQIREGVCTPLACLITFCLSRADHFLPDPKSYDDLFYKVVEANHVLLRFRNSYCAKVGSPKTTKLSRAADALTTVSSHYHGLLQSGGKMHHSATTIEQVIRLGHETLDLCSQEVDDFGHYEPWKESNRKSELKQIIRTVVEDARKLSVA